MLQSVTFLALLPIFGRNHGLKVSGTLVLLQYYAILDRKVLDQTTAREMPF